MASTTFKAIREDVASTIEGLTPSIKAHLAFKEVEDIGLIEDNPLDRSQIRRFQVDSGGVKGFQSVLSYSLMADSHKELVLTVIYPTLDNNKTMRDLADDDENLIIRTIQDPANRPSGVLHIKLENTDHTIEDGWRFVEYTFLVHYNRV
jgi:hypothetical protein